MSEETMTLTMLEVRKKNEALWIFVRIYLPFASGNLDKYLDIAIEAHRYAQPKAHEEEV